MCHCGIVKIPKVNFFVIISDISGKLFCSFKIRNTKIATAIVTWRTMNILDILLLRYFTQITNSIIKPITIYVIYARRYVVVSQKPSNLMAS